jgi:hypothetical protein
LRIEIVGFAAVAVYSAAWVAIIMAGMPMITMRPKTVTSNLALRVMDRLQQEISGLRILRPASGSSSLLYGIARRRWRQSP